MLLPPKYDLNYFVSTARAFKWEVTGRTNEPNTVYYLEKNISIPGMHEPYPLAFISRGETYAEKLSELKNSINNFTEKSVAPSYLELNQSIASATQIADAAVNELKRLYMVLEPWPCECRFIELELI